jgi:hypothetical protein
MTEQKFKSEMRRAETMRRSADPEMSEYWAGYMRGLRRAYHGEKFGTADEHAKWIGAIDSADEMRKQRGRGYHDGIKYGDLSSKIGRPSVGSVMLTSITVSENLKLAIEAKADELNMSIADARREAYRKFTEG